MIYEWFFTQDQNIERVLLPTVYPKFLEAQIYYPQDLELYLSACAKKLNYVRKK